MAGVVLCYSSCRDKHEEWIGDGINFETSVGTKALLNSDEDLNTTGSKIQVYDILNNFTGTINGTEYNNQTAQYFSEELTYNATGWAFQDLSYRWTRTGIHNFFGWLVYDAKSSMYSSDKVNPSYSNYVLTIPSKTITTGSDQFDFLYSGNVVVRDAAAKNYATVPLNMAHLFSAVALTVENRSNEPVTLNSISLPNLPVMNGSATIDYTPDGRTAPEVAYTAPTTGETKFFTNPIPDGGKVLDSKNGTNKKINAFTGEYVASSAPDDYRILWPVGSDILSPTTDNPHAGTGDKWNDSENNPADSLIRLSYQFTVTPEGGGDPITIIRDDIGVKFPSTMAFTPGKKTAINITISDKLVDLDFIVQEWVVHELPLDFSTQSATVTSPWSFIQGTYDTASSTVTDFYIDGAKPIQGTFSITNPVGASIYVEPIGDAGYFDISLDHDTVDPTVEFGQITVTVTPKTSMNPTTAKHLQLSFTLVNGLQEINIDSEVRFIKEGFKIIWSN